MAQTIRFPLLKGGGGVGPSEADQVIVIFVGSTLLIGGEPSYIPLKPWKLDENSTESPFPCIVIEFEGAIAEVIGNGTNPICLFGEIDLKTTPASTQRDLLGVLGLNFAGTNVPQIPLVQQAAGNVVGFAQKVSDVANYDALSIGTLTADLVLSEGQNLFVYARPIRRRDWMG